MLTGGMGRLVPTQKLGRQQLNIFCNGNGLASPLRPAGFAIRPVGPLKLTRRNMLVVKEVRFIYTKLSAQALLLVHPKNLLIFAKKMLFLILFYSSSTTTTTTTAGCVHRAHHLIKLRIKWQRKRVPLHHHHHRN